jgi:hypothetical protein
MPRFVFRKWTVLLRVPTKNRHGLVNRHGVAHVGLVCLGAPTVAANGSRSYTQSGDCNARSARREWATTSQGSGCQRDIRRALIEADLVDTALRDSAFPQSKAIPQVVSEAKDSMVALPGQLFMATEEFNVSLPA